METNDFDEILKETELDSAKMIFSLTSELKEKELELASLRSKKFEEIQQHNKAKEAEFEALNQAREGRFKKREAEIARLMVEKESQLWQKHQAILDEAITRHRAELEEERARLNSDIARKETEILEQKKNLRAEIEALFKKWETEREEDFKNERKTFIEELKLGRETARKEAEDRARQMEELWKEKFAQNSAETAARHDMELQESGHKIRQEHLAEIKTLSDRLNEEFTLKEKQLYAAYLSWLSDNKKLLEESFSARLAQAEADYSARAGALLTSLGEAEKELARRQAQWEEKHAELKRSYDAKEAALNAGAAENTAALREQFAAREKLLDERETKLSAEREELNIFRKQVADTIRQRETELADAFEKRYALLKESMEESARITELGLARKHEETRNQFSIISGQKDAALARLNTLSENNTELKRQLADKDAYLRTMDEQEHARASALRAKLEKEFALKVITLRENLAAGEETARKTLEESLKTETARLAQEYRIKEAGLAAQRDLMNAQSQKLEAKFMEALKAKEAENSENIKKVLAGLNAQLETSKAAAAAELAEVRRRAEEAAASLRAEYEARLKEKDLRHEQLLLAREKQSFEAARNESELENKKTAENYQLKLRDMENRQHALEQNLKFATQSRDSAQTQLSILKEEIELTNIKLDETEHEKQDLIRENLSGAKDLRHSVEKEFADKTANIEKNYLDQMADAIRRGEEKEKSRQDEYFRKLEFIKEEYTARSDRQVKDLEEAYQERENRLLAALEESYKLKEKALSTRFEQMERNYSAALSDKAMQLDNDRSVAENVSRLKSELEARNLKLNSIIQEHEKRLQEARQTLEASYAATRKDLEDTQRIKTAQLENERVKLKGLLEQEQNLIADLQKREAALQENYTAKEAALIKEFNLSKERLEADYQARLKTLDAREKKPQQNAG